MSVRLRERARAAVARLRRLEIALIVATCAALGAMYCGNAAWDDHPEAARGDGKYRPILARGDGHLYYLMTRSTVLDGDWVFDNDLARFGDPWAQRTTAAGRKGIMHPIGPILVWAPVLASAEGLAWAADKLGANIPLHGYTMFHMRIVFATTVLFAWLVILLGWRASRRWVGGRWGPALAVIAIALGTSFTYYATFMPSYPHVMDACGAALFLHYWGTTIGRRDLRRFAALGGLLGAATLVRSQELALGVVVALELGADLWAIALGRRRDEVTVLGLGARGALALAIALAIFTIQLYEWKLVYGTWGGLPQGPKFTRFGHPFVLETLFSARNGWFATTPLALFGALGLLCVPRQHRLVGLGLAIALIVQVYLCSTVYDWWSGASFSQRRLVSMSYPLMIGLAALLVRGAALVARLRVPRPARIAIAVVGLAWFVGWNLAMVLPLNSGKAANAELRPACCEGIPAPFRWIGAPIQRAIGNPFALPASAYFAARYGVPLTRWDQAVGVYPLVPGLDELKDGSYVASSRATWNLGGGAGIAAWLVRGFGESRPTPRKLDAIGKPLALPPGAGNSRWTTADEAVALVPLLMPDPIRAKLWLAPADDGAKGVELRWNGEIVAEADLGDTWRAIDFEVTADVLRTGTNTLTIATTATGHAEGMPGPVGVLVGPLELSFAPPTPTSP